MILRCTRKLLAVLGPLPDQRPAPPPDEEDWYANLLRLDRRRCLLLTHTASLFTVLEVGVTAAALRTTHRLVTGLIERELRDESFPADTFGHLAALDLQIAPTADRRVLGCMNDMALRCEYTIAEAGGLAHTDIPALNRSLRRNINSTRGYQRPIDLTANRLTTRH
jgi:hypothetical protein